MAPQRFAGPTGDPLWQGNVMDGQILGMRAMSSAQVQSATMIFGNWAEVIIGEWGRARVVRQWHPSDVYLRRRRAQRWRVFGGDEHHVTELRPSAPSEPRHSRRRLTRSVRVFGRVVMDVLRHAGCGTTPFLRITSGIDARDSTGGARRGGTAERATDQAVVGEVCRSGTGRTASAVSWCGPLPGAETRARGHFRRISS